MKNLTRFILLVILFIGMQTSGISAQDSMYQVTYEYGYNAGYDGGRQERTEGYSYEPEVVLVQPIMQAIIKEVKSKQNFSKSEGRVFDQAFRDGFLAGFKDGYYGKRKKETRFD